MTVTSTIVASACALIIAGVGVRCRPRATARPSAARPCPARRGHWSWLGVGLVAAVVSPMLGVVLAVLGPTVRVWSRARAGTLDKRATSHDFPDALDVLVLAIRAGYLPAQAIVEAAAFVPERLRTSFTAVRTAMDRGERLADALGQLTASLGPIAQPLVDTLSAAERYGLPLAPVLERLSFEARQQRRRDADANARELPVRLAVPLVLCTLPSFVLLAIVPLLLGALSSLRT
ncbi:MAG TPA: type II secretion system F family protein [Ilumatobacteraceae bacterium]